MFKKKNIEKFDEEDKIFEVYLCTIGESINKINRQMEEVASNN